MECFTVASIRSITNDKHTSVDQTVSPWKESSHRGIAMWATVASLGSSNNCNKSCIHQSHGPNEVCSGPRHCAKGCDVDPEGPSEGIKVKTMTIMRWHKGFWFQWRRWHKGLHMDVKFRLHDANMTGKLSTFIDFLGNTSETYRYPSGITLPCSTPNSATTQYS